MRGHGTCFWRREKILQIAFLIFSTSFQNLLTAPSLKGGSTALDSCFLLKAHTPKKYIIQTGNSFLLGKKITTMKTNLDKQQDNAGVLHRYTAFYFKLDLQDRHTGVCL